MSEFGIIPLDVGICALGKDHVLGDEYSADDRIEFALISFLVRGNGRVALIDLGPKTIEYTNDMFRRYGFFRTMPDGSTPDDIIQRHGNVFDGLAREGLSAADVTDVIFTHLHADHHGLDDGKDGGACEDFPNAVFHVSGTGWEYHLERRVDGHWNTYLDWGFGDFLLRKMEEGRLDARDNAKIAPGIETVHTGGHSVCSQAVGVQTSQGLAVIAGDDCYRYDLLERAIPARIYTSPERYREVSSMLAGMAAEGAIVMPAHDPAILCLYEAHGSDWMVEAKEMSVRAGLGYAKADPSLRSG